MRRHLPVIEAIAVLAATLPLALWQPAFWVVVPLLILLAAKRPLEEYGLRLDMGSARLNLAAGAAALGGYALGHYLFGRLVQGADFRPQLPPHLHLLIVHQVADVAFPEEFFFRGYLQTRLNQAWGRPYRLFGAQWGWGLPAAAIVFAACHLIYGDITQLKVFFFGLFAGWLRERTGGIVAPVLYHAAGNILLDFMLRSFR